MFAVCEYWVKTSTLFDEATSVEECVIETMILTDSFFHLNCFFSMNTRQIHSSDKLLAHCKWIFCFCRIFCLPQSTPLFYLNWAQILLFSLDANFSEELSEMRQIITAMTLKLFSSRPPVSSKAAQICNNCETCLRTTNGFLDSSRFCNFAKRLRTRTFHCLRLLLIASNESALISLLKYYTSGWYLLH